MLHCREVSKLVSDSMDRKLSFRQRFQVGMHLVLCRLCAGFARQVRLLRQAAQLDSKQRTDDTTTSEAILSQEARERIKTAIRDN